MRSDHTLKEFNNIKVDLLGRSLTIRGPLASKQFDFPQSVIQLGNSRYFFKGKRELFLLKALIFNLVRNTLETHFKKLTLKGIGFKCYKLTETVVLFRLGFTHKIYYILDGAAVKIMCKKGRLIIYGNDTDKVNNTAYEIKNLRKPDSYKGKGIIFSDEKLKLKSSKKRI